MRVRAKQWLGLAGLFAALSSTSCGGQSRTESGRPEPSSGGSTSDAGGASNSGAGGGAAGAPSSVCPVQQPTRGDYCNFDNSEYCIYPIDKCSSVSFECVQQRWLVAPQLDGASYDCNAFYPPNTPNDGDACECLGRLDCVYTECNDRGRIHAVCDNTSWHVEAAPCGRQVCGLDGLSCDPGELCLARSDEFSCQLNPCAAALPSCQCAGSLCKSSEECVMDSGVVFCAPLAR